MGEKEKIKSLSVAPSVLLKDIRIKIKGKLYKAEYIRELRHFIVHKVKNS